MRETANHFSDQMDIICQYVDFIIEAIKLAKIPIQGLRSQHDFVLAALNLTRTMRKIGHFTIPAYDGAYLTACAEYELAVRDLIEKYIIRAVAKCPDYHHLPREMKDWYPVGCAQLFLNLREDKYLSLTKDSILESLANCIKPSKSKPYVLIGEVYSDNDRNFKASEIEKCFKRIGIEKIWQKLSRKVDLQHELGTRNEATTEQLAILKLNTSLQRRNNIIHRGKNYYTTSESEVKECVNFFKALIRNLAEVMEDQSAAI